ncbi:MAG: T9SS type A sorting domain-containing protein [Candidatus Cyclonatronum sp.]|uniref:T9SS type A sorting domain-containing protein n=1 Tax=Cyclonatronum sp. TaxID=3024185 RepID=UPI0025C30CEA|nr:T9SS type A sorting domain-containing protein [Cyclonatronum sp.]MCH8487586.1 T9SS type A sorting domain-containing protein [Cyclonatronum sp.]
MSLTGGLIGYTSSLVADSYTTADVTGTSSVGGFTGSNWGGSVHRSYSTGAVAGESNVGGFAGRSDSYSQTAYSFWNTETSGQETSAGGSGVNGLTTAELKQQSTFAAFNFYSAWQISEGSGYPEFQDFSVYTLPEYTELENLSGSGTEHDPYIISTIHELNAVRQDVTAHYRLAENLDLKPSVVWNMGQGWEPFGDASNWFAGVFDGNGKIITGLAVNRPGTNNQGLFGYLREAEVADVNLADVQVYGMRYTGGLAGTAHSSHLSIISVTGNIAGHDDDTGGVIGLVRNNSMLSRLSADVNVMGRDATGGLIGRQWTSEVRYSYAKGTVTGMSLTGGLTGYTSSLVADSYTTADVTGTTSVGGFTGSNWGGSVHRSYSTGAVVGESNVGGFAGRSDVYSEALNSFWNTETSGQETSAGGSGVTGLTTADMTFPYATGVYAEWDFDTIWSHDEDHSVNAGYPHIDEGLPTSAENETDVPRIVKLHQNYPNPFNPITNISYELPQQQEVRLEVYNVLGRRVAVLVSGTQPAGYHTIQFDASRLASGMYLYRLQAGSVVQTHKMMLVR